jgi:hypothetical protein
MLGSFAINYTGDYANNNWKDQGNEAALGLMDATMSTSEELDNPI